MFCCIPEVHQSVQTQERREQRDYPCHWSWQWYWKAHGYQVAQQRLLAPIVKYASTSCINTYGLSYRFAKLGAKLILWDINTEANEAVAEEIKRMGKVAHAFSCDCSKREDIYRVADQVSRWLLKAKGWEKSELYRTR